jgi:hypothetical protein
MPNYKMTFNKTFFGVLLFLFVSTNLLGQDSLLTKNVICFTPTKANKSNGLTIGIWNKPDYQFQKFNGVNIELLGQGWLTPFFGLDDGGFIRQTEKKHIINGVSFGLTLFNGKVNGLTVSPIINTTYYTNGLKLSLINVDLYKTNGLQIGLLNFNEINNGLTIGIYNKANTVKGFQIGLVNRTETLNGFQIGLININKSRTTILVNWRTKKE